ncbi:calcineurin subunit B [Glossina fuscipes fuscipes]|uniref:EF-hand domain-containing protein n=1 Tax=Glossina palpalis gambiensis TaxID=67801 RepID=A0A1B0AVW9_9MUSC
MTGCCFPSPGNLLKCPPGDMEILRNTTNLKTGEISYLYKRFCLLGKDSPSFPPKRLLKRHFLSVGHLARNPILPILLKAMFKDRKTLTFVNFARFLSIFQANTLKTKKEQLVITSEKKKRLLFSMYDTDMDGIISHEDFIGIVHRLYGDIMSSKQVLETAATMIFEMDTSGTQKILFQDFSDALNVFDMEETLVIKIHED